MIPTITELQVHTDNKGIARDHNGLPAFCWFTKEYCLQPYCFQCSSFQKLEYTPHPAYDADLELFIDLVEHPDVLAMMGSATKKWYRKYKKTKEEQLKLCEMVACRD